MTAEIILSPSCILGAALFIRPIFKALVTVGIWIQWFPRVFSTLCCLVSAIKWTTLQWQILGCIGSCYPYTQLYLLDWPHHPTHPPPFSWKDSVQNGSVCNTLYTCVFSLHHACGLSLRAVRNFNHSFILAVFWRPKIWIWNKTGDIFEKFHLVSFQTFQHISAFQRCFEAGLAGKENKREEGGTDWCL